MNTDEQTAAPRLLFVRRLWATRWADIIAESSNAMVYFSGLHKNFPSHH